MIFRSSFARDESHGAAPSEAPRAGGEAGGAGGLLSQIRARPGSVAVLATVAFLIASPARAENPPAAPSSLDAGIRFFEARTKRDPDDFIAQNQLAERYLQKLRETGDLALLGPAGRAAEASLASVPPERNLGGVAALGRVQLAAHRFAETAKCGRQLVALDPQKSYSHALLGDALLELGDIDGARSAFNEMERLDPASVPTESRLTRLALAQGDASAADEHLAAARALAGALQPPSAETIAWCEVQLGELAFARGDWDDAGTHYESALASIPDYWAALEHLAELHGARGDFPRAQQLYEALVRRLPRPDVQQALGDLLAFAAKPEEAKPWHDRALAGYRKSVENGEVQFLHHLAGFFADVREDAAVAVKYARQDLELRHGSAAHELLGWALFRSGEFPAASAEMEQALGSGARSPHLLHHAGMVFSTAGEFERGQGLMREALVLNPRYHAFHVHR